MGKHDYPPPVKRYRNKDVKDDRRRGQPVPPERRLTREELEHQLASNRGFVCKVAAAWARCNRRIPLEEYVAAVDAGFVRAAAMYDKSRGVKFVTYAKHWADNEVRQLLASYDERRGPRDRREPAAFYVNYCLDAMRPRTHDDGVPSAADAMFAAPEPEERPEFPPDFWRRVRAALTDREWQAVSLRFRQDENYARIAVVIGVTRERVRQLINASLDKLSRRVDFGECLAQ